MLGENRQRSLLGLVLMVAQSFFFNAVFFTYGLVVKKFFHISDRDLPLHLLPFAVASFLGPLTLGRLFDSVGRKPMIVATYAAAGAVLLGSAIPFAMGSLGPRGFGICLSVVFYIASSAASAAYLTVSEIFPLEIRAIAIAIFLRSRHTGRRRRRTALVWLVDSNRQQARGRCWLCPWCSAYARRCRL